MQHMRFVGLLMMPSLGSSFLCSSLAGLIIAATSLAYNVRTGILYDLLFGPDSSTELIQTARTTFDAVFQTTFGNPTLNKIIFFAFWCLIGLIVYFVFSGIGKTSSVIGETSQRFHYFNAKKNQLEQELGLRLIIRAVAVLFGFLYVVLFAQTLLPFAVLSSRIGLSNLGNLSGWLYSAAGFAVLWLSLHIFIVNTRLLLLRPRIYGGWDSVLEDGLINQRHRV